MISDPNLNGNGRDPDTGRFVVGNKVARGNPHARRVARLRAELLREVKPADLKRVVRRLVELAAGGDTSAAKILLEHLLGRPGLAKSAGPSVSLPPIETAEDCRNAAAALIAATAAGTIDANDAGRLANAIEVCRRTIETSDLEERMAVLESELGARR